MPGMLVINTDDVFPERVKVAFQIHTEYA
jgi:hypothetical protein